MLFKNFLAILGLIFALQAFSNTLTVEEMRLDLDQLVANMKASYGPLEYKRKRGLDVDVIRENYLAKIKRVKSNGEFYYLMIKFIGEFQDGHFGAQVPTDHRAFVGFSVKWVDHKVLVDTIDRKKLTKEKFPFVRGDEIVKIDGVETTQVLDQMQTLVANGYALTSRALSAYAITSRRGARFPVPSKKQVVFNIRRGTSNIVESVTLDWEFTGTPLDEFSGFEIDQIVDNAFAGTNFNPNAFGALSIKSYLQEIIGKKSLKESYHCNGATRIAIPVDATVIMKKPFVAYYHKTEKGNVGYLRIPHYSPKNPITGKDEYDLRFSQYEFAVSKLEENTVGLVIDQDHNCGGSVLYLEKLLGLFLLDDYRPMQFRFLASKGQYLDYKGWISENGELTLDYQRAKRVADLIKTSWERGDFLTEKVTFTGVEYLRPNSVRYTKPILMLIDKMSGSGGDAFPVIMGGLKRATLFGERTMGLGGHVERQPNLNFSQLKYRMTKSLFYRPDGVAVENNGAVPEIGYTITRDDFLFEYKGYQKAYLKALLNMVDPL